MGGNTWAELAPTRCREPSQGCRPNLQAAVRRRMMQPRELTSGECNWESPIEGRTRGDGIHADPVRLGGRPRLAGKKRAEAPARDPG